MDIIQLRDVLRGELKFILILNNGLFLNRTLLNPRIPVHMPLLSNCPLSMVGKNM